MSISTMPQWNKIDNLIQKLFFYIYRLYKEAERNNKIRAINVCDSFLEIVIYFPGIQIRQNGY